MLGSGSGHPDTDFPADPYPGAVPPFSFVHLDERSHPLTFDDAWRVAGVELDRKVLADMAMHEGAAFSAVVAQAKAALPEDARVAA